jgi:hypothetical protein
LKELEERSADRTLKERLEGSAIRLHTGGATVLAAVIALISAIGGGLIQGWFARGVEADKSRSLIIIESRKADANIPLEKQKQESTQKLERAKFETELIL